MKYCPYCEKENDDQNLFCIKCGKLLPEDSSKGIITNLPKTQNVEEDTFYLDNAPYKKKYIISIILYFLIFYVFSTIVQLVYTGIWLNAHGLTSDFLLTADQKSELYLNYSNDTLAFTNTLTYVVAITVIIIILIPVIKKDLIDFKNDSAFYLKWFGIGVGLLYLSSIVASILIFILTLPFGGGSEAENQVIIENLLLSGGWRSIGMGITAVFLAPILEELIFRKCLFGLFKKNTYLTVTISAIIFASIHVVPACLSIILEMGPNTMINLFLEFINIISYLAMAFALAFTYHKAKCNMVPTILVHLTNNLISLLMIFVLKALGLY